MERTVLCGSGMRTVGLALATLLGAAPAAGQAPEPAPSPAPAPGPAATPSPAAPVASAPQRLDLPAALRLARKAGPRLGPARASLSSLAWMEREADTVLTLPPRVELSAGPRYIAAEDRVGPEVGVALLQDFSIADLEGARQRMVTASSAAAEAELEAAIGDALTEAALAWIDARVAREVVRIRERSLADATSLAELVRDRLEVGAGDPSEEAMAQAVVGAARAELVQARGMLARAQAQLRYATGLGRPVVAVGAMDGRLAPREEKKALAAARRHHPALVTAAPQVELFMAEADLARASAAPVVSVGPSVVREATADWLVMAQVSFPIPVVTPGAFAAAQSRRQSARAGAERDRLRLEVERDVRMLVFERDASSQERDVLHQGAVAPAREALRIARERFAVGAADLVAVLNARRTLLAAEIRWLEASAQALRADALLARATGALEAAR